MRIFKDLVCAVFMIANDNGVGEVSCTEAILDSIRTTESKAEQDECEDKDRNGDCISKILRVSCGLGALCYCRETVCDCSDGNN